METVIIILLIVSVLINVFLFLWLKNMKNIFVFIGKKKRDVFSALAKYTELLILFEKKDIYSADPTFKKLIYDSYKLKEYLNGCFNNIYEAIDLEILDDETNETDEK